jgi:hypothetical protein
LAEGCKRVAFAYDHPGEMQWGSSCRSGASIARLA